MTSGVCIRCRSEGSAGEACSQPGCVSWGYHLVPQAYADQALAGNRAPNAAIGQLWDEYLVVDRLGAGGVGTVFLALQQPIGLLAALKVLGTEHQAASAPMAERFQGEAAALAKLSHPNIVRLLKYGVRDGQPYLVMEYVEGGKTLHDGLRAGLSIPEGVDIVRQILNGLEAAHLREVVHRDIKPQNIMLQSVPGQPNLVRLVDFGLAKFVDEGHSTRLLAGTPRYMAPEQGSGRDIGPWTDLYAVAVITFEALVGQQPFQGSTHDEISAEKARFDPKAHLGDAFPESVVHFFRRALQPDPALRFRTVSDFRDAFEVAAGHILRGPPVREPTGTIVRPTEPTEGGRTTTEMRGEATTAPPLPTHTPRRRWWPAAVAASVVAVGVGLWALPGEAPSEAPTVVAERPPPEKLPVCGCSVWQLRSSCATSLRSRSLLLY